MIAAAAKRAIRHDIGQSPISHNGGDLRRKRAIMLIVNNYSFQCRVFVRTSNAIHRVGTNHWRSMP